MQAVPRESPRRWRPIKLREKGVHAGGFDLLPTHAGCDQKRGDLDFTIDQQPYLQGFYTVMVLFMYKISGGLTGPSDINTGLKFVTKTSVDSVPG